MEGLLANPRATAYALDCADARESFHSYCGFIELPGVPFGDEDKLDETADISFQPIETPQAAHHKLLIDKCEAIERGEIKRAMFFLPPGSAKSTYGSVAFPSWFIGRKKGRSVGVATYATPLALKMGRRVRSIVRQQKYQDIFSAQLAAGEGAVHEWALDTGSSFKGDGILAGWTGNRLDGLVIDDPVKNREEADSPVVQSKTYDEYVNSLLSRLKPNGWVILIMTRWNEADLAGKILPADWNGESGPILCRDGRIWEVVCIPAEAEQNDILGRPPGEMLWKEWFGLDPDFWTAARKIRRTWSALYQQKPSGDGGLYFERAWFDGGLDSMGQMHPRRRYRLGELPKNLRHYLTSDHAPTEGTDSDPNVGRVWGLDVHNDMWMVDGFNAVQKMHNTADKIVGNLKTRHRRNPLPEPEDGLLRRYDCFAWFPEDDNNWKSAEPFIVQQMREENVVTRLHPMSPHGHDKAAKAQSFQGMAAMGRCWIPEGPVGDAIVDQYVKFPAGAHDEEVDVAGIMGRAIAMAHPALVEAAEKPPSEPKGIAQMSFDQAVAQMRPESARV